MEYRISNQTIMDKLGILTNAAKFDVACTSSGVDRKGNGKSLGNCTSAGICHSFSSDGRCISLLKILMTNECIYDCKYCLNRCSNDVPRATFTPEEICTLTMEFYRRNYIEGLFLSSGIVGNPSFTMELLGRTIYLLRVRYGFNGYIHVKAIPGADPEVIRQTGFLVDRMSVNLELPTAEGLRNLAPNKHRKSILTPMRQIQNEIRENRRELACLKGIGGKKREQPGIGMCDNRQYPEIADREAPKRTGVVRESHSYTGRGLQGFVTGGQSTQMIIGATPENDYQILSVAENLYQKFELKRVFYSAFIRVNEDSALPALPGGPPLLREHRLYQADWLLRFYGFRTEELLDEKHPFFNTLLDPKEDWAVRHLEFFPVEVNRADYAALLRVPGIGVNSARRIIAARRNTVLTFEDLRKMGVVLKRALYFITCRDRMMYPTKLEENYIIRNLTQKQDRIRFGSDGMTYRQLSLFDDGLFQKDLSVMEREKAVTGQL